MIKIREVDTSDAMRLANLIQKVDKSSDYMLWESGEREISAEKQLKIIEGLKKSGNSTILVVEKEKELVGYLFAIGGNAKRNKHGAYIVIGIAKESRGMGIGSKLFKKLNNWAIENDICRLELTVVTKNESGLRLYTKSGFEIEGTKRKSLCIDGEFVDEYYMSKLI